MYQFDKIKLIIWDMDETFWNGTLSEGTVVIPDDHRLLIKSLTDIGIVNSICSKNDCESVINELKDSNLDQYFVFPSINWNPKGERVKQLIEDMQLRAENVLFLDDNPSNREEVRFFSPKIMVEGPEAISDLLKDAQKLPKKDLSHARLKQYRVLEEKNRQRKNSVSNEEFLQQSAIQVEIHTDCSAKIERIHDLIMRANQLNFTKRRDSLDELRDLLQRTGVECGYVHVQDRFGDYGIVGFYAVENEKLIHFVFSCRTLGMGIEQYVYNTLKRPKLTVVGEVISNLSDEKLPSWINQGGGAGKAEKLTIQELKEHMVLVKGPCDLFQIYPYIAQTELFDTEFSYTTVKGYGIESTGHTTHIVEALRLSREQKQRVLDDFPYADAGMYKDAIFKNPYKVVFLSILSDANLGVYQRKETGERMAFLEYLHPLTDPKNWAGLISGEYDNRRIPLTEEILSSFAEKYEFIGRNSPEQIVENLRYIREHLSKECTLVIMLGGELYYEKNTNPAYFDRHIIHKEINDAVRNLAEATDGIRLMDVNKYLVDQSSFYDHFNHYTKPIYYKLAEEMVDIVNECTGSKIRETSKLKMVQIALKEFVAPYYYCLSRALKKKR